MHSRRSSARPSSSILRVTPACSRTSPARSRDPRPLPSRLTRTSPRAPACSVYQARAPLGQEMLRVANNSSPRNSHAACTYTASGRDGTGRALFQVQKAAAQMRL